MYLPNEQSIFASFEVTSLSNVFIIDSSKIDKMKGRIKDFAKKYHLQKANTISNHTRFV